MHLKTWLMLYWHLPTTSNSNRIQSIKKFVYYYTSQNVMAKTVTKKTIAKDSFKSRFKYVKSVSISI